MGLAVRRTVPALVLAGALTACSQSLSVPFTEPAAAVVDGRAISMKAYQARLAVSRHRDPFAGIPDAIPSPAPTQRLEDFTVEQLVREEVIRAEAARRGIRPSENTVQARVALLRSRAGDEPFAAGLSRNGFTADSFASYQRALLTEVALLQKLARDRVDAAARELKTGDEFAAVAARWSDDRGTSTRAGDAGWLRASDLPEPTFEAAIEQLAAGATSEVVRTNRGFAVGKVVERHGEQIHLAVILVLAPSADLFTSETTPAWFTKVIEDREAALRRSGRIEIRVGSRAGG
jgi:parvulin-like peptidyl-prolyl isomerase